MRSATATVALLALLVAFGRCGGDGIDAPETPPPSPCRRVDSYLVRLSQLSVEGKLTHLAEAIGGRLPDDARRDLLSAVLRLLGGFEEGTFSALAPLTELLGEADGQGIQPTLGKILRFVAVDSPAAPYPAALADLRRMLATCEGAPVLGLLRAALEDRELIDALVAAFSDPGLVDALAGLSVDGEGGREALRLLLRNLLVAATNPTFDAREILDLLGFIVDLDAPPWAGVVPGLGRLLGEEPGKSALRGLLVCLREVDPEVALGPVVYDLLTSGLLTTAGGDGGTADPAAPALDTGPLLALLTQALAFLEEDPSSRRALATVGVELLREDIAPGVLGDVASLLEVEALSDIVRLLVLLATKSCEP